MNKSTRREVNLDPIVQELKSEFVKKCSRNSGYSLRAYSKQLGVDQSLLSKLLSGKRQLSPKLRQELGLRVGFKPSQVIKNAAFQSADHFKRINDEFEMISDWLHFAIMELLKTASFKSQATWIAKRLGVHPTQVNAALERLTRMGVVENSGQKLILKEANLSWTNLEQTSIARKQLQRTFLEKALNTIEEVPFADRDLGSLTVAITKARLPEFKKRLSEIRRELDSFFQTQNQNEKPDEVYQLCLSFYPLTKQGDKK